METTTKVQTMSPKWAAQIMERHNQRLEDGKFRQRPISDSRVLQYMQIMKSGFWKLTPEPIVFDENGDLVDGQHRVEACRRSGIDVQFTVTTGWPAGDDANGVSLIDVMDIGKPRTASQQMTIKGFVNAPKYTAALGIMSRIAWRGRQGGIQYSSAMNMLMKYGLKNHIDRVMASSTNCKDFKPVFVGTLAYYHTARPVKSMAFAEEIFNHSTQRGSPTHAYLKWMDSKNPGREEHIRGLCACVRAWDNNVDLQFVKPTPEAVEWLCNQNTALRDELRKQLPSGH